MNNEAAFEDCTSMLTGFFNNDIVILPVCIDTDQEQRTLIVVVRVAENQVDLFDRDREVDSMHISRMPATTRAPAM